MSRYKIVTRGEVPLGLKKHDVSRSLAQLCKYDEKKLKQVFSGLPFTFKSDLDAATADRYKAAIDKTGLFCKIEIDHLEPVIELATDETVAHSQHPVIAQDETMHCPKCGEQQPNSPTCNVCGIVIAKFNQRQQQNQYPEYVESAEDESHSTGWTAGVFKLVLLVGLCVGGYFCYTTFF